MWLPKCVMLLTILTLVMSGPSKKKYEDFYMVVTSISVVCPGRHTKYVKIDRLSIQISAFQGCKAEHRFSECKTDYKCGLPINRYRPKRYTGNDFNRYSQGVKIMNRINSTPSSKSQLKYSCIHKSDI